MVMAMAMVIVLIMILYDVGYLVKQRTFNV